MKLTETIISRLPTPAKPLLHSDDATPALYLKVAASGRKTFQYRTRKGGTWDVRTLGIWPDYSLTDARRAVLKLNGADAPSAILTFGELLDEWFERRIEPNYKVTANIQTYVSKGKQWLGNTKLTSLTTRQLVDKLVAYADTSPVGANRCLSSWKLALDYAVECGYLEINPLARTTSRVVGGKEKSRSRVLTDDEIRSLWALEGNNASLLRFLLCTGLRISEAQQGRLEDDRFMVDATKNGKAHWVAVPPLARQQVEPWPTSPTSVQAWLKRRDAGWTPHDLRRTFATRLAGLGVAPHVVEKCLNHTMQGVAGIYNREEYAEQRVAAAEQWMNELARIIGTA